MKKERIQSKYDQTQLSVWISEVEHAKGMVQLVHGVAEHKERYLPFIQYLNEKGYSCVIHDHRGHGESVESKEDYGHFHDLKARGIVEDTAMIAELMKERYHLPIYLFGHSMGSMVVRNVIKSYDDRYEGLIVCGSPSKNPAVDLALLMVKGLIKLKGSRARVKLIDDLAFGSFNRSFESQYPHSWICSDLSVVKAYEEDEGCGFMFTLDGFYNLFTLMKETYSKKGWKNANPALPILFIAGEDDPCIIDKSHFLKSADFMRQVGYHDVKAICYPHVRHEILNDVSKDKVMEDVVNFLNRLS